MTSKITIGVIVVAAFVAGTITTGTGVFAADHGDKPNGVPFKDIWAAINQLNNEVNNVINPEVIQLRTDINTNATKIDELEARIVALEDPIIP